jgi:predicted DNA-binding transcriptional regulator AlpA
MEEDRLNTQDECLTVSVPVAGKKLGLSRNSAYTAAARGDLPGVLRIGKRLVVSKVALQRALEGDWQAPKAARQAKEVTNGHCEQG